MITVAWGIARAWLGRNGMLIASIAGVIALAIAWDGQRLERAAAARESAVLSELNRKGAENDAKGLQAHLDARRPGAFGRLRERYCVDCSGPAPEVPGGLAGDPDPKP